MVKFTKQRNGSGCGPVAILNAIKWANPDKSFSYEKYYPLLAEACNTTKEGTNSINFKRTLYVAGKVKKYFDIKQLRKFDWRKINKHLKSGGGIILGSYDRGFHYSFWFSNEKVTKIYSVNRRGVSGPTVSACRSNVFVKLNHIQKLSGLSNTEFYLINKCKD